MDIKINFEKEFINLKRAVALCHIKLGYPVKLIAQIFNITERSVQFFIDEEVKKI